VNGNCISDQHVDRCDQKDDRYDQHDDRCDQNDDRCNQHVGEYLGMENEHTMFHRIN